VFALSLPAAPAGDAEPIGHVAGRRPDVPVAP
jgi:hypothetical protein